MIDGLLYDPEDAELVASRKWHVARVKNKRYARTCVKIDGKASTAFLHRLIMCAQPGQHVDHINGNGLDNRRSNLRFCTHSENCKNVQPRRALKGVFKPQRSPNYMARIVSDGRAYYLGMFKTEIEAARAYDEAAVRLHGAFARLNNV